MFRQALSKKRESGQAMTEFVIAATFVLLPLFVLIPLLGKYIDFKHAAVQAARYRAWEYTVWYDLPSAPQISARLGPPPNSDYPKLLNFQGIAGGQIPVKTESVTETESIVRLMLDSGSEIGGVNAIRPIRTLDDRQQGPRFRPGRWSGQLSDETGPLPFFNGAFVDTGTNHKDLTPFFPGIGGGFAVGALQTAMNLANAVIGTAMNAFVTVIPALRNPPWFSAPNFKGFSRVEFNAPALVAQDGLMLRTRLGNSANRTPVVVNFNAKAGVLGDGWNAGGTEHTARQVQGTTPSTMLNLLTNVSGVKQALTLVGFLAPELKLCQSNPPPPLGTFLNNTTSPFTPRPTVDGSLWLGYVDGDVVHPDRLSGSDLNTPLGSHVCDDAGRCNFDTRVQNLDPELSHADCIP